MELFTFLLIVIVVLNCAGLPSVCDAGTGEIPLVISTWAHQGFREATNRGYEELYLSRDRIRALIKGLSTCEELQCDGTVGYGGSPDEFGETRLDALIFDGPGHKMGAVASMANIKNAAQVALAVLKYSKHSLIAGDAATEFAIEMGFKPETLTTNISHSLYAAWKENNCQPNYRRNVIPDASSSCGPYKPTKMFKSNKKRPPVNSNSHDTIGMIVIDFDGNIAAGTSTNGATHKIPGRVGDSPIPGAGAYVDNNVGAAASTGDGDILMRFLPSYQAVESMRSGQSPEKSAEIALERIAQVYPNFSGALIASNKNGLFGAACHGFGKFQFSIRKHNSTSVQIQTVNCI